MVKFAEDFQTEYIKNPNETENNEFTVKGIFAMQLNWEDTEGSAGASQ